MPLRGFLKSEGMRAVAREVEAAIASRDNLVICGEPGTGRVVLARAIHRGRATLAPESLDDLLRDSMSRQSTDAPFVVVDCGAGREVEQPLFGRTGAPVNGGDVEQISDESLLHQSFGGTLVLRSVQEMPGRIQARLARVLRDGEVWIEGSASAPLLMPVDVRVAAIVDGCDEADGRIVGELQRRLAAHRIVIPPLRQRREDIPALVRWLLTDICESLRIPPKSVSRQAMALLTALPWTGNFKKMRGLLRPLALKVPGRLICLSDVLANIRLSGGAVTFSGGGTLKEARERFEREYVAAVLEQHHGRMAEAARALGIQRTNLYRKVKQLSVSRRRPGR
jgi:DNA-binding NtrC family response regulator